MRILVTGGLGFIGHNVVAQLQQQGHTVRVLDSIADYDMIPADELLYLVQERRKKFEPGTVVHEVAIESIGAKYIFEMFMPHVVIHLASMPRQKVVNKNPIAGAQVMCEGLVNLLEASVKHGVEKFVYVSSSMVYGDFADDVKETAVCNPRGQYAIMKYLGERLVEDYSSRDLFKHVILRPSAVYGPLDTEDRVVSKFMLNAMRNETINVNGASERLDFTYVEDVAAGIVAATLSENTDNKTYNITRSKSVSLLDAANVAVAVTGARPYLITVNDRDLDFPSRGSLNIDAARQDFNFNPQVDIERGYKQYHDWLKNSSYWKKKLN
jgi:nucleoside-diphosphate-sugar epimerase